MRASTLYSMSFGSSVFRALYGATGTTPAASRVVVPAERVVGAVSKHPDRFLDGERVTRDAHRRLLWRLLPVNSAAIGIFCPVETIVSAVAVVVLFGGWIVAFRRVLVGGHRPHVGGIDKVKSSRPRQAACSIRRFGRRPRRRRVRGFEEAIDRVSRRRSIEATVVSQTTVFWSSRVTGRMP